MPPLLLATSTTAMPSPFVLDASDEEISRWANVPFSHTSPDAHACTEGMSPVLMTDRESGSFVLHPMFPFKEQNDSKLWRTFPADLISSNPACWDAFCKRRCLIPVSALCIQRTGLSGSQEMWDLSSADADIFALAGVWDDAATSGKNHAKVFKAITVLPSILLSNLFREMPVIVRQSEYNRWLKVRTDLSLPVDLLRPLAAVEMKRWKLVPVQHQCSHEDRN